MNGSQIENVLRLIDQNVDITRQETLVYLREHQAEVVEQLTKTGRATVKTSAGELSLRIEDLTAAAA